MISDDRASYQLWKEYDVKLIIKIIIERFMNLSIDINNISNRLKRVKRDPNRKNQLRPMNTRDTNKSQHLI